MERFLYLYTATPTDPGDERNRAALMAEQVTAAAEAGFTGVWLPEHHATANFFPPPFQMLAWLSGLAPGLAAGTAVALPALYHPVHLAESVAALAWLTERPVALGLGTGFRRAEFEAFGVELDDRLALSIAVAQQVDRLLSGETVTFEIGPWRAHEARLSVTPRDQVALLWAARSPAGVRTASRFADGILPNLIAGFDAQADLLDEFDRLTGRRARSRPVLIDAVLCGEADRAPAEAARRLGAEWAGFRHWRSVVPVLDEFLADPMGRTDIARRFAAVGGAEDYRALEADLAARGVDQIGIRVQQASTSQAEALEGIRVVGEALALSAPAS
ncbi:MAG: LLM class flavin-dependent oxidoreductase [Acidimicrobiia bacterium]